MIARFVILILVFAGSIMSASSKIVDDYLHDAGYKYVAGRQQEAALEIQDGLRQFPNDAKLKTFNELLKKMQDQQRQDQNQQGGESKDSQQKDSKDQKNSQSSPKDSSGQKDSKPEKDSEKESEKDPKKDKEQENAGKESKDSTAAKDSSASKQKPPQQGQMSPEEAERLLNSFQDDEKKEQRDRQRPNRNRPNVEEDW